MVETKQNHEVKIKGDSKETEIPRIQENDTSLDKHSASYEDKLASTFATFWNICNTIQGLPILVIPYAVRNGGYLAILTLLLVAVASNYTGKTIVRCLYEKDSESGKQKRVRNSYADVGNAFLPKVGGHLVLGTQFL